MWCFCSSLVPAHIRLGKLLVTKKKKKEKKGLEKKPRSPNWLCLTFVMTGIQWEKEREEEWEMGGEEENGGVAEGDRCVKLYVWKK